MKMIYGVKDKPVWYKTLIFAIQQVLAILASGDGAIAYGSRRGVVGVGRIGRTTEVGIVLDVLYADIEAGAPVVDGKATTEASAELLV